MRAEVHRCIAMATKLFYEIIFYFIVVLILFGTSVFVAFYLT